MCRIKAGLMTMLPVLATPSVAPSGGALATASMAMLPLAPGRLSITTGWPVLPVMWAPRMRAAISVTPPAEVETMIFSGFDG
jgi:hypothetical protein